MILSLKRKRIQRERAEAVGERLTAARDFVAAIREAEAALDAMKVANDRFYKSDALAEQLALSELRQSRERMFQFTAAKDVVAEAPHLSRLLGVKVAATQAMPFIDFVIHSSKLDFDATGEGAAP